MINRAVIRSFESEMSERRWKINNDRKSKVKTKHEMSDIGWKEIGICMFEFWRVVAQ